MARNWKEVRKHLGPEREARIKARVRDEIGRLSLNQLREARSLTQTSLAELLGIPQGGVSRMERRIPLECSGGITLANVRGYAETGVDFISVGALTHSAPAVDLSLRIAPA